MSLLHQFGFDEYSEGTNLSDISQGLDIRVPGSNNDGVITTSASFDGVGKGLRYTSGSSTTDGLAGDGNLLMNVRSSIVAGTNIVVGYNLRVNATTSRIGLASITNEAGQPLAGVIMTGAGFLQVTTPSGDGALSSSTVPIGEFIQLEFKFEFAGTNRISRIIVRRNGTVILDAIPDPTSVAREGVDVAIAAAPFNSLTSLAGPIDIDDIYVLDSGGLIRNDFLGEARIVTFAADALAGTHSGFTTTSTNSVEDILSEIGGVDFYSSDTAGDVSTYTSTDTFTGTVSTIHSVTLINRIGKSDIGERQVRNVLDIGGVLNEGTNFNPAASFLSYYRTLETNPSTGFNWLDSEVTALGFGAKIEV